MLIATASPLFSRRRLYEVVRLTDGELVQVVSVPFSCEARVIPLTQVETLMYKAHKRITGFAHLTGIAWRQEMSFIP